MCYAKPGPRCSSYLKDAQTALLDKHKEITAEADTLMQEQSSLLIVEDGKVVNEDDPEVQDLNEQITRAHEELNQIEAELKDVAFQWHGTANGQEEGYDTLSRMTDSSQQRALSDTLRRADLYHQDRMDLYRASQVSMMTQSEDIIKVRKTVPEGIALQQRLQELGAHQRDRDNLVAAYSKAQIEDDEEAINRLDSQVVDAHFRTVDAQEAAETAYQEWVNSPGVTDEFILRSNESLRNNQPDMARMYERAVVASTHSIEDYRRGLVARPPSV